MTRLKQKFGGLALVLGGLLTFNANAVAQENPEHLDTDQASGLQTSLKGAESRNRVLGLKLKEALEENGAFSVEFTFKGKPYVASVNGDNIGIFEADNPFQSYTDNDIDGELDKTPPKYGMGSESLAANRDYTDLLNQAITSVSQRSKNDPKRPKTIKEQIIEREQKVYELVKKTGESDFEFNIDVGNGSGLAKILVEVGGFDVAPGKPPVELPKRIKVASTYYTAVNTPKGKKFQLSNYNCETDTNGDGELEGGSPTRFIRCLDALLEKDGELNKGNIQDLHSETARKIMASGMKYREQTGQNILGYPIIRIPELESENPAVARIAYKNMLEMMSDNNEESLCNVFTFLKLMKSEQKGKCFYQMLKQRALEIRYSMQQKGTWEDISKKDSFKGIDKYLEINSEYDK